MTKRIEEIDRNFAYEDAAEGLRWYDARELPIEGLGFSDTEHWSDRLPVRAKDTVGHHVWHLSHHTAGVCVRFRTDSTRIAVHWVLRFEMLALPHMPATGVSGLDLYVRENGKWRWVGAGRPADDTLDLRRTILNVTPIMREYLLYFPVYNGIDQLEIGVDSTAAFTIAPPRPVARKPLVFYGTSVVQGGCASRPGMVHPAILGRWFDCESINFGFSGVGMMRPEILPWLAELDASVYIIDSIPNMTVEMVAENSESFLRSLRQKRPGTPIVVIENMVHQFTLADSPPARHAEKNRLLRAAFDRLIQEGVTGLHYFPTEHMLGDDWEATVDGSHFSDLGFMRMAEALSPVLKKLIG